MQNHCGLKFVAYSIGRCILILAMDAFIFFVEFENDLGVIGQLLRKCFVFSIVSPVGDVSAEARHFSRP